MQEPTPHKEMASSHNLRLVAAALVFWGGSCAVCHAQTITDPIITPEEIASLPLKQQSIRFVGCKSDGQVGPVGAPEGKAVLLPIPAQSAKKLVYYKSKRGPGVLAPNGWHCFGTYGSGGAVLYVSPEQISSADLFSISWSGFTGPAIEIATTYGDTSGRFGVAEMIERIFPTHSSWVEELRNREPGSIIPDSRGPYSTDKLIYRNNETVEYQTPPNTDGLGTDSKLRKNGEPINGVEMLVGRTPNLVTLSIRLDPKLIASTPIIIQEVERSSTNPQ